MIHELLTPLTIREGYQQLNGQRLWVRQILPGGAADGPWLVFLHDALGSVAQWKDFPQAVCRATGLPGLVYDRQGHGHSDPLSQERKKDYLHQEALEVLPALLDCLNIQAPVLVGHSDGGSIALIYAARHAVTALVAIAAHIYVESIGRKAMEEMVHLYESGQLKAQLAKYHGDKTDALFWAWADTWMQADFADWQISELLPAIQGAALIIQGKQDPYATDQHALDIAAGIGPHAQCRLIADCGHLPHKEKKEELLEMIVNFVQKTVSSH
ncbi:MAG: alpha/beta hydrolase [Bacteroidetes bacterium]|nr:MAG: alpha/beta hydrolase [Bacteroidota bacterium]